jgi:hypothetical protein
MKLLSRIAASAVAVLTLGGHADPAGNVQHEFSGVA